MSVSKTASGKGWRARVKSGRVNVASKTFPTRAKAKEWEAEQKALLKVGEFVDPKLARETVGSAVARWMDARAGTVAGSTFKADRYRLRYLPPRLLGLALSKVRTADLSDFYADLIRSGLSAQTVARVRALLSAFWRWAAEQGMTNQNPALVARVPRGKATGERQEVSPFSIGELREVVAELSERASWQASIALVLGLTGVRWGELVALRVRDLVAVPSPALMVTRSAPDGQEVRTQTKGGRGRMVPLAAELVPIVNAWAQGKAPDDLLFTSPEGKRLSNPNWRRAVGWSASCRGRRVHDLRHTAASFWIASRLDVKTIQSWLGHESAKLTLDLYGHLMGNDADAAALARVNAALDAGAIGGTRATS